jgi:hypothetical protein
MDNSVAATNSDATARRRGSRAHILLSASLIIIGLLTLFATVWVIAPTVALWGLCAAAALSAIALGASQVGNLRARFDSGAPADQPGKAHNAKDAWKALFNPIGVTEEPTLQSSVTAIVAEKFQLNSTVTTRYGAIALERVTRPANQRETSLTL